MPRSNSRSLARFHPAGPSFPFLHTGSHSPPLKIMAACQPRLWSNDEETRELPGECEQQYRVQAGEEGHARPGWTTSRRGQDSPWKSQSERQRTKINGESTSMVWPTVGSKSAKEQNRTVNRDSALMTRPRRLTAALRLSGAKNTFAHRGWNFNCATTAWMSCSRKSSMREWCEVCRYICLSVYQLVFLRNRIFELHEIFCACYSVAVVRRSSGDNICKVIRHMGSNKTLKNYKEKAEIQTNQSFTAFWHIQGDIGLQLTDRPIYLNSLQSPFLDAKYFRRPL